MHKGQLRELIQVVLKEYDLYSRDAEELLMLTAAAESRLGYYIKQVGGGPALGIFQCEPNTLEWVSNGVNLKAKGTKFGEKWNKLNDFSAFWDTTPSCKLEFTCSLMDQILACRLVYYFKTPKALPNYKDVRAMAEYHKKYYNSILGAATVEGTIELYNKYVK